MKKVLTIICIVVMIATLGLSLFACGKDPEFGDDSINDFVPEKMNMGLKQPTFEPTVAISEDSTPKDILDAITTNFEDADFVATYLRGNVITTVLGGLEVQQVVVGDKMRHGAVGEPDTEYWADNKSYSSAAKVYDETYIKEDNVQYREGKKVNYTENKDVKDAKANGDMFNIIPVYKVAGKDKVPDKKFTLPLALDYWGNTTFKQPVYYEDGVSELVKATKNDITKIWMYDTGVEGAVKETSQKVTKVPGNDHQYKFSINFNLDKVTTNYKSVMEYMLVKGAGKVEGLTFAGLRFDFVVWDNGYLADLYIKESYSMKVAGIINADVTLYARQQYSYDEADKKNNKVVKFLDGRRQDAIKNWATL